MLEANDVTKAKNREPYEKPAFRIPTREMAKIILMGEFMMGNQEAKQLLELIFAEPPLNDSKSPKDSEAA